MTPHIMVQTCHWCQASEIEQNCISTSDRVVYCAPPVKDSVLRGREALRLGLIEHCIYKEYHESQPQLWWNYMGAIGDCERVTYSKECTDKTMRKVGVDERKVSDCLSRESTILKGEHELWQMANIVYNPAVVINNHVYRV